MTKQKQYLIRPPKQRNLDPINKYKHLHISAQELDEIFGGELCQKN